MKSTQSRTKKWSGGNKAVNAKVKPNQHETALALLDNPENGEKIKANLQAIALKLSERLMLEADEIAVERIPVSLGIVLDKLAIIAGNPTSISQRLNVTIDHAALVAKIQAQSSPTVDLDSPKAT